MSTKINTAVKTITPAIKVQAALRLNEASFNKVGATPNSVARRFKITEKQALKFQADFNNGQLTKKNSYWNPSWDDSNTIAHPIDSEVFVDMQNGNPKDESALLGFFEQEFDPINGVYHFDWSEDDILAVIEGLPYRLLQIIRDCKPSSELYKEAEAWFESDMFAMICEFLGYDAEELVLGAKRLKALS